MALLSERAESTSVATVLDHIVNASGGNQNAARRGEAACLKAYGMDPWLHVVVQRRAEEFAKTRWRVFRRKKGEPGRALSSVRAAPAGERERALKGYVDGGELEEITDHPVLRLLKRGAPSANLSGAEVHELWSMWLDLVGTAPTVLERKGKAIVELSPIVPTWLTAFPSKGKPFYELSIAGKARRIAIPDMMLMRAVDPADPFGRGLGTARVLADEIETNQYMAETAKARFRNRNMPDFILGLLGIGGTKPSEAAITKVKADIEDANRGPAGAGRFHLIGSDIKVHDLSGSFKDAQYTEGRRMLRDTTVQGYGSPPEIVGVLDNSNKGTIHAAAEHFAVYSTEPKVEKVRSALQVAVLDEYGDDAELAYWSPVPSDREEQTRVLIALPGAATVNEVRAKQGLPPRPDGDVYMAAPGAPSQPIVGEVPKQVGPASAPTTEEDLPDDSPDTTPDKNTDGTETVDAAAANANAVQDTALNGAQVASLLLILEKVSGGVLTIDGAQAVIAAAFPAIPVDKIKNMLAGVKAEPEVKDAVPVA